MASALLNLVRYLPGHLVAAGRAGIPRPSPAPSADLSSRIGEHFYVCIFNERPCQPGSGALIGAEINIDTVVMTVITMALILVMALLVRWRLSLTRPRGLQNVLEYSFEFVNGFVADNLGNKRVKSIGPLAVALFLFILISNYIGLLPVPLPEATYAFWHSPTDDLNTTTALAIIVFILIQFLSVRARGGGGYVKHFFQPLALSPINIIEEITKPVTLAFRLFGNIFAGEVLLLVFGVLLSAGVGLIAQIVADALGLALGVFIGAIQAFIFAVLTVAYIGIGTSTEGH